MQNLLSKFCRLDLPASDHYLAEFLRQNFDKSEVDIQDGISTLSTYGSADYAKIILAPANNREVLGEIIVETEEPTMESNA